ncbi:hypothetical protein C0583_05915 [Candidatus Parcubacteria bacterium]|nr:MAG: hypothetical protein C0583_05915 [Candidatus Parcubacteria bacterium]
MQNIENIEVWQNRNNSNEFFVKITGKDYPKSPVKWIWKNNRFSPVGKRVSLGVFKKVQEMIFACERIGQKQVWSKESYSFKHLVEESRAHEEFHRMRGAFK